VRNRTIQTRLGKITTTQSCLALNRSQFALFARKPLLRRFTTTRNIENAASIMSAAFKHCSRITSGNGTKIDGFGADLVSSLAVNHGVYYAPARVDCRISRRKSGAETSTVRQISYRRDLIRSPIRSWSVTFRVETGRPLGSIACFSSAESG